jgi:hypothetical protein
MTISRLLFAVGHKYGPLDTDEQIELWDNGFWRFVHWGLHEIMGD